MNLEMIMTSIIGSLTGVIAVLYCGNRVFGEKCKINIIYNLIIIILFWMFMTFNYYIADKLLKTVFTFLLLLVVYKQIYNNDWNKAITGGLSVYLFILLSEMVIGGGISIVDQTFKLGLIDFLTNSIALNIIIMVPAAIMTKIYKKQIKRLIDDSSQKRDFSIIVLFLLLALTLSALLNKIYIGKILYTYDLYINIIVFVIVVIILIATFIQSYKYQKVHDKYRELMYYSKLTDEVLEEYSMKTHEYKNQLAIVKSLIKENENFELNEYLNNLIENQKNMKYSWVNKVKYINLSGLKGLINYKIAEFNLLNINTSLTVSKELENISFDNYNIKDQDNLYTIIGVYLDNAKEASLKCENPNISIDISNTDDSVKFIISNNYNEKIEESKLDNYRYSTKGKNRGIGLHLVNKIINKSDKFSVERKITDKYYIQVLCAKK